MGIPLANFRLDLLHDPEESDTGLKVRSSCSVPYICNHVDLSLLTDPDYISLE